MVVGVVYFFESMFFIPNFAAVLTEKIVLG